MNFVKKKKEKLSFFSRILLLQHVRTEFFANFSHVLQNDMTRFVFSGRGKVHNQSKITEGLAVGSSQQGTFSEANQKVETIIKRISNVLQHMWSSWRQQNWEKHFFFSKVFQSPICTALKRQLGRTWLATQCGTSKMTTLECHYQNHGVLFVDH